MEVSFESNCLIAPEAAFLVLLYSSRFNFLRSLLKSSNDDFGKYTSPLTSTISGGDLSNSFRGIDFIVFKLLVISSPIFPSPLVEPCTKIPFSYLSEIARPSILSSQITSGDWIFNWLEILVNHFSICSLLKTLLKLNRGDKCSMFWKLVEGFIPTLCVGESKATREGFCC